MEQRIEIVELSPETRARLGERADHTLSPDLMVDRELGRYYALLDRGRAEAHGVLSADELGLIVDASNGSLHSNPYVVLVMHYNIADAIDLDGLDLKWGVDGRALVEKLEAMSPAALVALVDAAERFWSGASTEEWAQLLD